MNAIRTTRIDKTAYYITDECELIIEREEGEKNDHDYVIRKVRMYWWDSWNIDNAYDYKLELQTTALDFSHICTYAELSRDNQNAGNGWECIGNSTSIRATRDKLQGSIDELVLLFRRWADIPYRLRWMCDKFVEIALEYPEIF